MRRIFQGLFVVFSVLLLTGWSNEVVHAEDNLQNQPEKIQMNLSDMPSVDIKLAVGETSVDVDHLKDDLTEELKSRGINMSGINLVTAEEKVVSTEMADAEQVFKQWGRVGWTGQWVYDSSNKTIINRENTDNFTGFYNPVSFDYRHIDFSYSNAAFDGDDDIMGAMVRFNINPDKTVTSYVFLLDKGDNGGYTPLENKGGLYKIVNGEFNWQSVTQLVQVSNKWSRYSYTDYRILADGNNIQVYQGKNKIIDYTDINNPIKTGSYGFFSYSQPNASFRNIKIVSENTLTFPEVMNNAQWNDNSLHYLINLTDKKEAFMEDAQVKAEILGTMKSKKIHYIGWGGTEIREDTERFVIENGGFGAYIDKDNYKQSLSNIVDYIIWTVTFQNGKGTESDPYLISSYEQFLSIRYKLSAYYKVVMDIDFGGTIFYPIGSLDEPFTGGLDGSGHVIGNFTIGSGGSSSVEDIWDYTGFFRVIHNAKIKNVAISNADIKGRTYVGGLAGNAYGSETIIQGCSVEEVLVEGTSHVGGFIGKMESGTIIDCSSSVSIYGNIHIGGFAGFASGTVFKNLISIATVTGNENIGGFIGTGVATRFETCQSFANVNGYQNVGAYAGYIEGSLVGDGSFVSGFESCDSFGTVKGSQYIGGFAGYAMNTNVKNCTSGGEIEGSLYLGGIIGEGKDNLVTDCQDASQIMTLLYKINEEEKEIE